MCCVSRSVSTLVAQSGNEAFQAAACRAASTDLNNLKDAIHVSPYAAASTASHALAASVDNSTHGWPKLLHLCIVGCDLDKLLDVTLQQLENTHAVHATGVAPCRRDWSRLL